MFMIPFQIVLGIIYANALEWLIHKYVLHELGKKFKNSIFRFHWSDHHKVSRKNHMLDLSYNTPWWKDMGRAKEVLGLAFLALTHLPLLFVIPWFAATTMLYTVLYYFAHKRSHLNKEWAKKWLPWHFLHHLGRDQDKNWGVLLPFVDWVVGTKTKN